LPPYLHGTDAVVSPAECCTATLSSLSNKEVPMPRINIAVRAAAAVVTLAAGTTAGIATAAVHAPNAHVNRRHAHL